MNVKAEKGCSIFTDLRSGVPSGDIVIYWNMWMTLYNKVVHSRSYNGQKATTSILLSEKGSSLKLTLDTRVEAEINANTLSTVEIVTYLRVTLSNNNVV